MEPGRLETADILPFVKAAAIQNVLRTGLDDLLFIGFALTVAVMGFWLINRILLGGVLSPRVPTLPSFFLSAYFILMSLPATLWFYAATTGSVRYTYFLAIQSVLIFFPLGVFLANLLSLGPVRPSLIVKGFVDSPLQKTEDDLHALPLCLIMLFLSVVIAGTYLATSSYVPLIGALTAYGELAGSTVRSSVFWEGDVTHYAHALTVRFFLPFSLMYSYFMADVYKGRWRAFYWMTLILAVFISSMTFDRTYPFSIVIFLGLAIYFRHKNDQSIRRSEQLAAGVGRGGRSTVLLWFYIAVMIVLGMFVGGLISRAQFNLPLTIESIWTTSTGFLVDRVLLDASYMAYIYFEEFSKPTTFLYGQSFHVLISSLFGIEFQPTISPSFVAELWINFGWFGVVIGTMLVGFVLQMVQLKLFDTKTIPALGFYVILMLNGAWIIYGHLFATMVISVYLPSVLLMLYLRSRRMTGLQASPAGHFRELGRNTSGPHQRTGLAQRRLWR